MLFQKGEAINGYDRIVRVGTHNGDKQLYSRLTQHFSNMNKNRSIFRKNIGRAFLAKLNDPYIKTWEIDTTSRSNKIMYSTVIDKEKEGEIENKISNYIQADFSFSVFEIKNISDRLNWEQKIASTIAQSHDIPPSSVWLGNYSPKSKIRSSGLWQVNQLNGRTIDPNELEFLLKLWNNR
ncbi:MAG TPA: hypothetical protein VN931_03625 [Fibrobacteria bacterium]|nr:hypothetical protein [Fibrobacteria bacterium]